MRRRDLIIFLVGAMGGWQSAVRGQQIPVVGYLSGASPGPYAPFVAAFRQGLADTGYAGGKNVAIEYRWAEGHYDRLAALAADLVGRKVDLIAASGGTVSVRAAKAHPRRSQSSSRAATIRSRLAWSPVSPGRAATSQVSASSMSS